MTRSPGTASRRVSVHIAAAHLSNLDVTFSRSAPSTPLASIHVRREALTIRVEVRDLPLLALSQQGGEARGSLIRGAPVRVGAAPTKPGRVSTARWGGSGERDGEEYERNQRYYVS